jgi:hypothetical protein
VDDPCRAAVPAIFQVLEGIPGVRLFNLQQEGVPEGSRSEGVADLGSDFDSLADAAGALHHMDLVISVDAALLHLAGAMGRPAWALLPFAANWRWLLDREDSPWYPTLRLFRQSRRGDWPGVLDRVAAALRDRS